jgi:hypothetical protein
VMQAAAAAALLGLWQPHSAVRRHGCQLGRAAQHDDTVRCWAGPTRVASMMTGRSSAKSPAGIGMNFKAGLLPPRHRLLDQLRHIWRRCCVPCREGLPPHR